MRFTKAALSCLGPFLVSGYTLTAWTASDCSGTPAYTASGDDYSNGAQSDCIAFGADIKSIEWTDTGNAIVRPSPLLLTLSL
jgi:hypothetical protein